jgi:hypothetical protein
MQGTRGYDMLVLKAKAGEQDVVTGRTRLMLLLFSKVWGSACCAVGCNKGDAISGVQNVDRLHFKGTDSGYQ